MQRTDAGFPDGMPGILDEIEGAMQHAAQLGRHSIEPVTRTNVAPFDSRSRKVPELRDLPEFFR
jgi:hypothetical protein